MNDEQEFLPPNGAAYEKREVRTGPPLSYVAEKLQTSLRILHEGLTKAPHDAIIADALRYSATAFLALHNMLALAQVDDWFARLVAMKQSEFRDWTQRVAASGAVSE